MNCKIEKSKISGQVSCPPNKSYTHRAIFLASIAGKNSRVENALLSADTIATIEACKKFGAEIEIADSTIIVKNPIKIGTKVPEINTENSGTTIRIASGIASLFSEEITLTGDSSLQKRPMQPLLDALSSMGAQCSSTDGKPPIKIKGKIAGGEVKIPGNFSSQYISALLICAPLTEKGINLTIDGNLVSKPYLDATIATMRKFGVTVQTLIPYKRYNITPQIYKETTFTVPIDFSSLALLLSAAVLNGEGITIKGSIGNLPQGDEVFIDILEKLGVKIAIDDDQIKIESPEKLNGGKFDLSNSPDLLPPLAILALRSSAPIEIFNVKHARLKETDRIAIMSRELVKLGIKVQEKEDGMILEASENISGADLISEEDHRLFMAFCIAGMFVGNCTVTDPESVKVSYPNFIEEMKRMGAKIKID
ncbi:MAG: 3-phosphoshikimate 1-carboxyvinyltransferase [Nitrosopumilus sp.]|nr:3-phosphoshikimate 1-carboxyvinyltransferase [Nitrosopumilus sp.]MDF2423640.1 3-phosphoshikimate 1-carboxyvinyltransferase [Nitrosopumilus sp.]MDF2423799.1 3-phosphoshikimate 1-carboxyvinyltransferase [Nitrosopumilus sp.]MDF2425629.1 3-phosphoshikimate 1-carboxyvinyltransferase [Nitrosopumilus sp.]MDF2426849.1 3-phosphoshikimate 1-carboxyvinyltransferase [Nitrosopumilus sp.]